MGQCVIVINLLLWNFTHVSKNRRGTIIKKKCLPFKHEKNNQTLSNDWPTYCHTGYSNGHYISGFYLTFVICVVFSSPDLKDHVSYCNHSVSVDHCATINRRCWHFTFWSYKTTWPIQTKLCRNHICVIFNKYSQFCLHPSKTLPPCAVLGLLCSDRLNVWKS